MKEVSLLNEPNRSPLQEAYDAAQKARAQLGNNSVVEQPHERYLTHTTRTITNTYPGGLQRKY
jgi:hypothetical protein